MDDNSVGPLKTRRWVWVISCNYHLNGCPATTEVVWIYRVQEEANKHRDFLQQKMTEQLGPNGATKKNIRSVTVGLRLYSKALEKHLLAKFVGPHDPTSREVPGGHMPYKQPTHKKPNRPPQIRVS